MGYACFQEKYYEICIARAKYYGICIARAGVNESVCENSHAEHVQFGTAADSTPFRT